MARNDVTRATWSMLEAVRPAWWVLRAWVAVSLLDALAGPWENLTVLPTLGVPVLGPVLLLVAVVLSVLIGQGSSGPVPVPTAPCWRGWCWRGSTSSRSWRRWRSTSLTAARTSSRRSTRGRFRPRSAAPMVTRRCVAVATWSATSTPTTPEASRSRACSSSTRRVDRSRSRPASTMGVGADRQVTCPWFNGTTPLFNVFPLPQRPQRYGTCLGKIDPAKVGCAGLQRAPVGLGAARDASRRTPGVTVFT